MRPLLFLIACIWLVACNQAQPADLAPVAEAISATAVPQEDTLKLFWWQAPEILNPHLSNATKDLDASRLVYEPLASFDSDGELIPFLAAEIPSLENGTLDPDFQWVIWKLKEDVVWSDGEPFTAEDVVFTYQFVKNHAQTKATTMASYTAISNIEILDDFTVRLNFHTINPAWALPFVGLEGMILPEHIFADYNNENAVETPANMEPVGTGPYMFESLNNEEVLFLGNQLIPTIRLVYVSNPLFRHADILDFSRVELKGGGTADAAARAVLQFNEADFADNLQLSDEALDELEQHGYGYLDVSSGGRVEHLWLNHSAPAPEDTSPHPWLSDMEDPDNLLVRQAIAYAIDRDAIAAIYGHTSQVAYNVLVTLPQEQYSNPSYEYDPELAEQLLDQAGWLESEEDVRPERWSEITTLSVNLRKSIAARDTKYY